MLRAVISRVLALGPEYFMSGVRPIACGVIAALAVFLGTPADAQNLDAGKTPAQIFADTCSACHRRPQELKRASVGFLRSHYTTGQQEAASMANYLASIPADPRATQKKRPGAGPTPPESVPSRREEQSKGQPKEQAKSPAVPSKSRRAGQAEAKAPAPAAAAAPEIAPPEPPPTPAAPPPPPLEPFEE